MMTFPSDLLGTLLETLLAVSLPLSVFLAVLSAMLIVTSQMLSSQFGKVSILISEEKFRKATILIVIAFLINLAVNIFSL
jgi:hypothetical protein